MVFQDPALSEEGVSPENKKLKLFSASKFEGSLLLYFRTKANGGPPAAVDEQGHHYFHACWQKSGFLITQKYPQEAPKALDSFNLTENLVSFSSFENTSWLYAGNTIQHFPHTTNEDIVNPLISVCKFPLNELLSFGIKEIDPMMLNWDIPRQTLKSPMDQNKLIIYNLKLKNGVPLRMDVAYGKYEHFVLFDTDQFDESLGLPLRATSYYSEDKDNPNGFFEVLSYKIVDKNYSEDFFDLNKYALANENIINNDSYKYLTHSNSVPYIKTTNGFQKVPEKPNLKERGSRRIIFLFILSVNAFILFVVVYKNIKKKNI